MIFSKEMSITQIKGSQILDGSITTEDIDDGLEKDFTKVRVTTGDSSPDFLSSKLIAGSNITLTVIGSSGSSQTLSIASSGGGGGGGSTSPGGSNSQVQFNDSNTFGGDAGLTYNKSTSTLSVANLSVTGSSTTISGDSFEITGSLSVTGGISGSLTRLSDGSSYLVAGNNIMIVTSSVGQVTISSTASGGGSTQPGGSTSQVQFNLSGSFTGSSGLYFESTTATLTTTNLTVGGTSSLTGDIFEITGSLAVTGGISGSLTQLTNGSSYLIAGNSVTITTSSSGQVTISTDLSGKASTSTTITAGDGLTGGGDLSANRTLGLATAGPGAGTVGTGTQYISSITLDAYGRVSSASASTPTFALPLFNVASVSSTYTMSGSEDLVALDPAGVFTVYLPASPATGKMVIIKDSTGKSGTNSVTLNGNGKTIDGYNTFIFSGDYTSLTLVYTGQNWSIV